MKIIIDAMGGDHAPLEIVKGAIQAYRDFGVEIVLTGDKEQIQKAVEQCGAPLPEQITVRHCTQVIEMCDDPAYACRRKKDSSMTVGLQMLHDGEGDAFISAGSTGALLSGARHALQLEHPRVALLNIGAEESKGMALQKEAYALLKAAGDAGHINFIGNIEAKEALKGGADVIVADGFSGNVMLKTIEGVGSFLKVKLKAIFFKNLLTKVAALLVKDGVTDIKNTLDPNERGATPFLGISKPVLKAHGSSNARAIRNAVKAAIDSVNSGLEQEIAENIALMQAPSWKSGAAEEN